MLVASSSAKFLNIGAMESRVLDTGMRVTREIVPGGISQTRCRHIKILHQLLQHRVQVSLQTCHMYGITSIQEASANTLYLHALREIEDDKELKLDVHTHIICGNEFFAVETKESLEALLDVAEAFKSKHVDTRFVKFWLDGSPIEPGFTSSV